MIDQIVLQPGGRRARGLPRQGPRRRDGRILHGRPPIGRGLTAIPGSSDVVERGFVTYSNEAKMDMLGVSQDDLEQWGAVSEPVASPWPKVRCVIRARNSPSRSQE